MNAFHLGARQKKLRRPAAVTRRQTNRVANAVHPKPEHFSARHRRAERPTSGGRLETTAKMAGLDRQGDPDHRFIPGHHSGHDIRAGGAGFFG